MNIPYVSVLMTAYNREKYIAEAIESVLAQTYNDFELIIVDDRSTDNTLDIARRYLSDKRVHVHINKVNLGDYPNRNRAAQMARGKYIKYLDSDDYIYPFGLAAMVEMMDTHSPAALGIQRPSLPNKHYPILLTPKDAYHEHFFKGGLFGVGPTGVIMLASAFRELGGFSGKRYVGDFEMWLKMAAHHPVVKFMEGLVWWRSHGEQEISIGYQTLTYAALEYNTQIQALLSCESPLSGNEQSSALRWLKFRHARNILRIALHDLRPDKAAEVMRETSFAAVDLMRAFDSIKRMNY